MKTYIQPQMTVIHIDIPHTIDVSGGDAFWGESDADASDLIREVDESDMIDL